MAPLEAMCGPRNGLMINEGLNIQCKRGLWVDCTDKTSQGTKNLKSVLYGCIPYSNKHTDLDQVFVQPA